MNVRCALMTAAEAAINECAMRSAVVLMRETGSRREGWNSRCSWVENTRLGAALSFTFRDGPAAGLGGCTCTLESRSLGQDGVRSTFRPW